MRDGTDLREHIGRIVFEALQAATGAGDVAADPGDIVDVGVSRIDDRVGIERPRDPSHGDYATNVALRGAKPARTNPRALAEAIVSHVPASVYEGADALLAERPEVAGPGFINFRLSASALRDVARNVHALGTDYGRSDVLGGRRVQVEFVSANPVGPMHVGHGRWAALGDSIARLLEAQGAEVEREFYINDAGVQMDVFAKSVAARYMELNGFEVDFGEDWYRGAYITEIAREILEDEGEAWADADPVRREAHFKEKAYAQVLEHLKRVLHGFGVDFDVWFSERTLHEAGPDGRSAIERAIDALRESDGCGEEGCVYESEGATWFRTTAFGGDGEPADDKDRVLVKADGAYTYFAADVAYHKDKLDEGRPDRGFDLVIDIWGADHHGYVPRMLAAAEALGHPGKLELVIGQLVNLFRAGEAVRMSKRTGEMVTFEDLLDEVGPDAARYYFLRRSTDQPVDFDIALATEQSQENPVYYVQYAHARICSILRKAAGHEAEDEVPVGSLRAELVDEDADLTLIGEEAELDLLRALEAFPETVEWAAANRSPHRVTRYCEELAASFHQFYTRCRVMGDDEALTAARLYLVDATRIVLATGLGLLGVDAVERM